MTVIYDPLYKTRKDGKTQIWWMERDFNKIRSHSAQYDGKVIESSLVTSTWKEVEGTNEGRANERKSDAQADFEIKRHYRLRAEAGAVYNLGDTPMIPEKIFPILAHEYDKLKKPLNFPVYSQAKLDGMRSIVTSSGMWSRNWKPVLSAPHIAEILEPYTEQGIVFDGELYNHELKNDFNKIMSLAKKLKPKPEDLEESSKLLQYWVFDIIVPDTIYSERLAMLKEIVEKINHPQIILPPSLVANNQEELDALNDEYIMDGYEGQMIRYDAEYEHVRSRNLLKRKSFITEEFTITHIEEGEGNWSGVAKVIHCVNSDGKSFKATLKNNYDYAKKLHSERDLYISGEVTVRYQNLTPDGVPRFPVAIMLYPGSRKDIE